MKYYNNFLFYQYIYIDKILKAMHIIRLINFKYLILIIIMFKCTFSLFSWFLEIFLSLISNFFLLNAA